MQEVNVRQAKAVPEYGRLKPGAIEEYARS
jgi:hypothetical protein